MSEGAQVGTDAVRAAKNEVVLETLNEPAGGAQEIPERALLGVGV